MYAEVQDRPRVANETTMHLVLAEPSALPRIQAWAALEQAASEPNPFFAHWFLKPALTHLTEGRAVWLATLWSGEQLDGLMPLRTHAYAARWQLVTLSMLYGNAFDPRGDGSDLLAGVTACA
jgi:hypothetical protein